MQTSATASGLFLGYLMTELSVLGGIQLKSGSFDKLLLIITFPLAVSVRRAIHVLSDGVFEDSNCTEALILAAKF